MDAQLFFFPPLPESSVKQAPAYTAIYVSSYCYICVLIHLDVSLYEFFAESAVKQKPCCARVSRGHTHTNTFSCQSRVYTIIKLVTQVYAHTGSIRKRCLPIVCPPVVTGSSPISPCAKISSAKPWKFTHPGYI
jgi:hypothetical protein